MKLREAAERHEQKVTKNIVDLECLDINAEVQPRESTDKAGKLYKYNVTVIDGIEYRIPGSVLGQIKELLKKLPNTQFITVTKAGTGLATRYNVMPFSREEKVSNSTTAPPYVQ